MNYQELPKHFTLVTLHLSVDLRRSGFEAEHQSFDSTGLDYTRAT